MHGRIKGSDKLTTEQQTIQINKLNKYNIAKNKVLEYKKLNVYNNDVLKYTSILLNINPEFYTIWNYRINIITYMLDNNSDNIIDWSNELQLVEQSLMKNPKCYIVWYYRLWCIDTGKLDLHNELILINKMLTYDNRNFVCWNYRRSICTRIDNNKYYNDNKYRLQYIDNLLYNNIELIENEFNYTTQCININFSNYSAWHYRSMLLHMIYIHQCNNVKNDNSKLLNTTYIDLLLYEFTYIQQAIYTSPKDQSSWLYYRWIISQCMILSSNNNNNINIPNIGFVSEYDIQKNNNNKSKDNNKGQQQYISIDQLINILQSEINTCNNIIELENDNKYAILTYTLLNKALEYYKQQQNNDSNIQCNNIITTYDESFNKLQQLDPQRKNFYIHLHDLIK